MIIGQNCHIHPNVTIHPHTVMRLSYSLELFLEAMLFIIKNIRDHLPNFIQEEFCAFKTEWRSVCCTLEDQVILWGQVGISSGLFIGKGAVVLAQSGVSKNLEGNKTYFGYPAQEVKVDYRSLATLRELSKKSSLVLPAKKSHQNNEL